MIVFDHLCVFWMLPAGWWVVFVALGTFFVCLCVKGARWMPWHDEPMKDVGDCDMPRGVVN